ncbi:MAG: DNRLRE domain-containing protein [Phycisphaerales bacterium]
MNGLRMLVPGVVAVCAGAAALADSVSIGASHDNTLYETTDGSLSNGAGEHLFVGRAGGGEDRRGLVRFDVAGAVPSGATVTAVTLTLNLSRTQTGPQSVQLHRLNSAWGEGTSDATGNEGGGAPAEPGDATWLHTFHADTFWNSPGGDFESTFSHAITVNTLGRYVWDNSAAMIADVQLWLDDDGLNFGWLLLNPSGVPGTAQRFDTRENADQSLRPFLRVEFTPIPAPATAAILVVGIMSGQRRRRTSRN